MCICLKRSTRDSATAHPLATGTRTTPRWAARTLREDRRLHHAQTRQCRPQQRHCEHCGGRMRPTVPSAALRAHTAAVQPVLGRILILGQGQRFGPILGHGVLGETCLLAGAKTDFFAAHNSSTAFEMAPKSSAPKVSHFDLIKNAIVALAERVSCAKCRAIFF